MSAPDSERPLIAHLIELRNRLLWCVAVVMGLFFVLFAFAQELYRWTALPVLAVLPENATMIAATPTGPFLIPMKLAFIAAIFLATPYLLYQLWAFVAPGLYRHERRLVWPLMASSTLLFYAGAAFARFIVLPFVLGFLMSSAPEGVLPMPDIGAYLDFVIAMFLAFGAAFEIPVATVLLVRTGAATVEGLKNARPYVIVGAFVVAAIVTPPDVLSQLLLAVPMCLLFELGLLVSAWVGGPEPAERPEDSAA